MPTANFIPGKISDLTGAPWLSMRALGGVDDGTTDNTAIVQAALTAMGNGPGGVLYFERPAVAWRIDGQLTIPTTGPGTAPQQKSIRLTGEGPAHNGQGGAPSGGSILDLRYAGADAKILTLGLGYLEIDHLTLKAGGTDSTPFILTTFTTAHIHNVEFFGNPGKSGTACDQDAIVLGGASPISSTTPDAPFQGYGTVIRDNYFNRIRRAVYGRTYCNAVQIADNTIWNACGSNLAGGAAIEFDGHTSNSCSGNWIAGNLIEMPSYSYGIKLEYSTGIAIVGNNFYDPGAGVLAYVRFENHAVYNLLINGYAPGAYPLVSDVTDFGSNTIITPQQGQASWFSEPVTFRGIVKTRAGNNGYTIEDDSGRQWFQDWDGTNQLSWFHKAAGVSEYFMTWQRLSATDYRLQLRGSANSRIEAPIGGNFQIFSKAGEALFLGDPSNSFYVLNGITHRERVPIGSAAGDQVLGTAHNIWLADANAAPRAITLPTAVGISGRSYTIKKIDVIGNAVTVTPTGGQTVDGAATYVLATQYQFVVVTSNGTNWVVTGKGT